MNVLKALTAAEYSRRQFILNFAASRDTQLLIPGQKSDAVKAAEEWVAGWLSQNGYQNVNNEFFKYTVDARLWSTHGTFLESCLLRSLTPTVGDDVEFPFAFMRGTPETSPSEISSIEAEKMRPKSEAFLIGQDVDLRNGEMIPVAPAPAASPRKPQEQSATSAPQTRRRRSIKQSVDVSDKKRSMSLNSIDELKNPKVSQDKFPFLVRLGRSWSRRVSAAT